MLRHAAATLALLLLPLGAAAQQKDARTPDIPQNLAGVHTNDPEFRDPTNAALLYYRAFLLIPEDLSKKISEASTNAAQNPNWTPDADLTKDLREAQGAVNALLRAAKIDAADFGIEYSQGIAALLPHLSKMRAGARLLAADARRCVAEGRADEAAERTAALFTMARHCTNDRLLIAALVGIAVHALACTQAEYLMNNAQLTEAGKQKILAAADRFNAPDPFGIKSAIRGERFWCVVWIRAQCAVPDGLHIFATQILPMLDDPEKPDAKTIREMDLKSINADLDKADAYYTEVLAAFDQPDAEARLAAAAKKADSGEFGIIAKHVAPAMGKCYTSNAKAVARQTETRTRLTNFIARPN